MANLKLKDIKFEIPIELNPTEKQLEDWFAFEFGITKNLSLNNPLSKVSLSDCNFRYGSSVIDLKKIEK